MSGIQTTQQAANELHGLHYERDEVEAAAIADQVEWDNQWPEIDGDGVYTGSVVGSEEGYANVGDIAMISLENAKEGGWRIDPNTGDAVPAGRWTYVITNNGREVENLDAGAYPTEQAAQEAAADTLDTLCPPLQDRRRYRVIVTQV